MKTLHGWLHCFMFAFRLHTANQKKRKTLLEVSD